MLYDLAWGMDRFRAKQGVNMIFHSADLQCGHIMRPRDAANVSPDSILDFPVYKFLPVFCAENDVIKQRRI
jgi:hypothetical protein